PSVNLGPDLTGCTGDTFMLFAGNTGTYLWSTGSTDSAITVNAMGSYSVTVSNGFCFSADTMQLSLISPPLLDLGNDIALCEGESVLLVANVNGGSYLWSTGEITASITVG